MAVCAFVRQSPAKIHGIMKGIAVNPKILKQARESLGMSFDDVAARMGVASDAVAKWESGEKHPTYSQLEKLAYTVYKRPLALFFFPSLEEKSASKQFRSLPAEAVRNLSIGIRLMARKANAFLIGLRELFGDVNPAKVKIFREFDINVDSNMRDIARRVRECLGVSVAAQIAWRDDSSALRMWRQAVENAGISVFRGPFKDHNYSGFCLHDVEFPIIYINSSMTKNRQIFTIFHEMAHILMGKGGVDFRSPILVGDRTEAACNRFAAEVLLPGNVFLADIEGISDPTADDINNLARRYKVSRETIWLRFLTEQKIDRRRCDQELRTLHDSFSPNKGKEDSPKFPVNPNQPSYLSAKYTDMALAQYHQRRITDVELSRYLGIKNLGQIDTFIDKYLRQGAR